MNKYENIDMTLSLQCADCEPMLCTAEQFCPPGQEAPRYCLSPWHAMVNSTDGKLTCQWSLMFYIVIGASGGGTDTFSDQGPFNLFVIHVAD